MIIHKNKKLTLFTFFCIALLAIIIIKHKLITEHIELFLCVFENKNNLNEIDENFQFDNLVAHAGGEINGLTYTNSLEALEKNYNAGFRFFEIDLDWTNDYNIVLSRNFPKKYNTEKFKSSLKTYGLTTMTLEDLHNWLLEKNDAYIITHFKKNNTQGLKILKRNLNNVSDRIIPQAYSFKEYFNIRRLGFDKILITLYKKRYNENIIIKFIKKYPVSGVVMPINMINKNFVNQINNFNIPIFIHTVNNTDVANNMKSIGIFGFYTDFLKK